MLKAHTENRSGVVSLRSTDPRDVPDVNFHYFSEGSDTRKRDLASIIAGIKFVRRMTGRAEEGRADPPEALPGDDVVAEPDLEHLSPGMLGASRFLLLRHRSLDQSGVLNGDFRVLERGACVVDARFSRGYRLLHR